MSLNRIAIIVTVAGYTAVNVLMQINFFQDKDIFAKYQEPTSLSNAVDIAQDAYYAKTAFLLILLILLTFRVSFPLGFAISMTVYAVLMLAFFGLTVPTTLYAIAAVALISTYLYDRATTEPAANLKAA